jgi:mono/diheme cytochrome c family protein
MSSRSISWIEKAIVIAGLAALAIPAQAQRGGGRGAGGGTAATGAPRPVDITAKTSFDMTSVERGGKTFAAQCASCHGANARGGTGTKTDVDLLRSEIVVMDHSGRELPGFLAIGRPEKQMPKFELSHDDGVDLAAWLHYQVSLVTLWQQYTRMNVLSGDPKAGEAFFNGSVGKCSTCHSVTGDLKGIGQKDNHDAGTLQAAILGGGGRGGGRGGGGAGGGRGGGGAAPGTVTANVTLQSGEKFTGTPSLINDFVVEIKLPSGESKSWLRNNGWPQVTQVNKLQPHIDLMTIYTDADIHNLAAYLNDK